MAQYEIEVIFDPRFQPDEWHAIVRKIDGVSYRKQDLRGEGKTREDAIDQMKSRIALHNRAMTERKTETLMLEA